MNEGRTVFAQLLDFLPQYEFDKCVTRYHGNFRVRKLPAYEQFLVLAFAQLTWRESLRDIETCLASFGPKLYHAGIRQPTSRSTLADANENRDWRIFADFAHILIEQATTLFAEERCIQVRSATNRKRLPSRHFCSDASPFFLWRKGLHRNRNVFSSANRCLLTSDRKRVV